MSNTRVILDLRGLAIKSYYGDVFDTVMGSKGTRVPSAASGVKNFIDRHLELILSQHAPIDIIGVCEGAQGNIRRRAMLPGYKAKPQQDADDTIKIEQRDLCYATIQKLLLALGSMLVKTPTVEADDTIAYLVERLRGGKIIHTVDNDLMQLHAEDVQLVVGGEYKTSFKGMDLDVVGPGMVRLYKSIIGDSTDDYNGVKGMGVKAWEYLVETYGYDGLAQLEQCVDNADYTMLQDSLKASPCKALQKLYDQRDEWRLSYQLARLHPEWCELSWQEKLVRPQWAKRVPEMERLEKVLKPIGLDWYLPRFKQYMVAQYGIDATTEFNQDKLIADMKRSRVVAFDYESYDCLKNEKYQEAKSGYVDVLSQRITGCSFAFGNNLQKSVYFSINHRDTPNLPLECLNPIFDALDVRGAPPLVAHNAPFEMTLTKTNLDRTFETDVLDTRIMASHVDENSELHLKLLSKHWLNYNQTTYNEVVQEGDMRDVSLAEVLHYGCDDSVCTAHLFLLFKTIMECEQTLDFYLKYEPAFDRIMVPSFIKGIPVDMERLSELEQEDRDEKAKVEAGLRALLSEHCAQINERGFATIWPEIEQYQARLKAEKAAAKQDVEELNQEEREALGQKVVEAIGKEMLKLRQETYDACRYHPIAPPKLKWYEKSALSLVAKSLGLPAIRSTKQAWTANYHNGIHDQAAEQGILLQADQHDFLTLLYQAREELPFCAGDSVDALAAWCQSYLERTPSLWEGDELNIDSPKQMAELFYGKMGLPILMRNIDKTDSGKRTQWDMEQAPSTNETAIRTWLAEINDDNDWRCKALEAVLKLRAISTRFKLYYNPYPLFVSPVDGNIHPGIKNCGTKTRRPSGSSPNVLQVSKIKDKGRMRGCFLPMPNEVEPEVVVSLDFVQQELLITAGESRDPTLMACYVGNNRRDVHSTTGSEIYNVIGARRGRKPINYDDFVALIKAEDQEAIKIRKRPAKETNFLTVYGGSAAGLSRKAIVPRAMAEDFLAAFFKAYPKVKEFQERMVGLARRHGFVTTCFGTRKHCDGIFDKNGAIRSSWERQAINEPIQGGAADVLKVAMRNMDDTRVVELTGATVYAPVYDEVVASVPVSKVVQFIRMMERCMEIELPGLGMTLITSVSLGPTWGEQEELGEHPSEQTIHEALARALEQQEAA